MSQASSQQRTPLQPGKADPTVAYFPNPHPVLLKDLPTTLELQESMDAYCQRFRCRRVPLEFEEYLKLYYHYSNQEVVGVTRTRQGLVAVAAGTLEQFGAFFNSLPPEEQQRITWIVPPGWDIPEV